MTLRKSCHRVGPWCMTLPSGFFSRNSKPTLVPGNIPCHVCQSRGPGPEANDHSLWWHWRGCGQAKSPPSTLACERKPGPGRCVLGLHSCWAASENGPQPQGALIEPVQPGRLQLQVLGLCHDYSMFLLPPWMQVWIQMGQPPWDQRGPSAHNRHGLQFLDVSC